jgi:preprotein translocase subunit YajC
MEALLVLAVTFLLLWLLFIRPQQRRVREHQALVDALQPGDRIVLTAGIHGRIVGLDPRLMTVEVAPGVRITVERRAVLRVVDEDDGVDEEAEAAGDEAPMGDGAPAGGSIDDSGGGPPAADPTDDRPGGTGPGPTE